MRPLKPYLVEEVSPKRMKTTVAIMFDRDSKDFFATVGTIKVRSPSADGCRREVYEAAKKWNPLEWTRLISAHFTRYSEDSHHWGGRIPLVEHEVRFEARRFERAEVPDQPKCFVDRPFAEDLDEHLARRMLEDPYEFNEAVYHGDSDELVLPYTEETWAALLKIKAALLAVEDRLDAILSKEGGGKLLLALAAGAPLQLTGGNRP